MSVCRCMYVAFFYPHLLLQIKDRHQLNYGPRGSSAKRQYAHHMDHKFSKDRPCGVNCTPKAGGMRFHSSRLRSLFHLCTRLGRCTTPYGGSGVIHSSLQACRHFTHSSISCSCQQRIPDDARSSGISSQSSVSDDGVTIFPDQQVNEISGVVV